MVTDKNRWSTSVAFEKRLLRKADKLSFADWAADQRHLPEAPSVRQALGEVLTPLLLYLSLGNQRAKKTFGTRAWVLLYALRPDLIEGETMAEAAKGFGLKSEMSLVILLREFREMLPGFELDTNARRGFAGTRREEVNIRKSFAAERVWKRRKGHDK